MTAATAAPDQHEEFVITCPRCDRDRQFMLAHIEVIIESQTTVRDKSTVGLGCECGFFGNMWRWKVGRRL